MATDHTTTRQQRRHAKRQAHKQQSGKGASRADLIRAFAVLAETYGNDVLPGATIIMPGCKPEWLDARLFRRGARA